MLQKTKEELRKDIALLKKLHTPDILSDHSEEICRKLEEQELFRQASCIAIYHALPGEVQTTSILRKWHPHKKLLLPLIQGYDLSLYPYTGENSVQKGNFGIWEPIPRGTAYEAKEIDLIIVPGIAFDQQLNRMGRGKGFYDRLLSSISAPKIGICFDFQLRESIPCEAFDIPMDMVITEKSVLTCTGQKPVS
ncbi:MAG: 5-formyltetrahydrofolate cyclo-ligase [Tannerellaceae bacterium]|nr:5-formyltetrahydrofolate cyclo-ligase [Tannerellaceae bacterium]